MILALCVLASAVSVAAPAPSSPATANLDSILVSANPKWDRSKFPPAVYKRVHMNARLVPPYPMEDRLSDPHAWPNVMNVSGLPCSLQVMVRRGQNAKRIPSVLKVPPGVGLELTYVAEDPNRGRRHVGPMWFWAKPNWVAERSWVKPGADVDTTEIYQYYESGELFWYANWIRGSDQDPGSGGEAFEEVFASNGNLIGFRYRGDTGIMFGNVSYYMGTKVGDREYEELRLELRRALNRSAGVH